MFVIKDILPLVKRSQTSYKNILLFKAKENNVTHFPENILHNCNTKVVIKTLDITLWKSTRTYEKETAYDGRPLFVEAAQLINQ